MTDVAGVLDGEETLQTLDGARIEDLIRHNKVSGGMVLQSRGGVARGGRHRHHEYHARLGDGAHARDGIRKALGARRDDVLLQFLIESVVLSLIGGALGVISGIGVAEVVTALIGMPSSIKLWAVLAGLVVAGTVGVFLEFIPRAKPRGSIRLWRSDLRCRELNQ